MIEIKDDMEIVYIERLCHYCGGPMGNEIFRVIKGSDIVDAHKSCYKKSQHGGLNIRIIVK